MKRSCLTRILRPAVRRTRGISDLEPTDLSNHDLCIIWIMNLFKCGIVSPFRLPPKKSPKYLRRWYNRNSSKPRSGPHTHHQSQRQCSFGDRICRSQPEKTSAHIVNLVLNCCSSRVYILNHNSCSPFSSPPPLESSFILFTQPALFVQIISILFHSVRNPLSLTNKRWHPFRIVERRR